MKRFSKIFAVVLSVVLVFSIFCLPASAKIAGGYINFGIKLEKVTTTGIVDSDSGADATELGNIYKVVVSLDSNVPVNRAQVGVAYDADLFDVCYGDDTGNYLTYPCGDDTGYTAAYARLGTLNDADAYDANGAGGQTSGIKIKAYGPSHASAGTTFVMEQVPSTDERYTNGVKWAYTDLGAAAPTNTGIFVTKYVLSNNLAKGVVLPQGKEDLVEVYLMLKDGKTDADVANTEMRMTLIDYSADATPTKYGDLYCWFGKSAASTADTVESCTTNGTSYIYSGAAAAAPVLTAAGRQIKMTLNEAGTDAVAGTEQLRVVSSFSAQDWNDYFVNTGKKDADGQPIKAKALKEVGIVASKGAFDLETAKGYAMQGKGEYGDYKVATTDYIQQTKEGLYRFGARIEYQTGVYDTTYIAFATYWDENSVEHTIFYGAQADIAYNTNHSGIVNAYIAGLKK